MLEFIIGVAVGYLARDVISRLIPKVQAWLAKRNNP